MLNLSALSLSALQTLLSTIEAQISKYTTMLQQAKTQYKNCTAKIAELKNKVTASVENNSSAKTTATNILDADLLEAPNLDADEVISNLLLNTVLTTKDNAASTVSTLEDKLTRLNTAKTEVETAITNKASTVYSNTESAISTGAKSTLVTANSTITTITKETTGASSEVVTTYSTDTEDLSS
jgi:chromosome segregation ATPase